MPENIIIIGNGVACITAAFEARENNATAKITVISKESPYFFSRTALMYEFVGQMSRKDLEPFERKTYREKNIDLLQDEVVKIDPEKKRNSIKQIWKFKF